MLRTLSALLVSLLAVSVAPAARADGGGTTTTGLSVDWGKLVVQGLAWVSSNSEKQKEHPATSSSEMRAASEGLRTAESSQVAWFGVAPQVSVVARDWGDVLRLTGRLSPTDQVRLSRSSRMVVTRIRVGEGHLVPFAQLGLGQWRIDTDVLPGFVRDTEIAAQFGGGLELRLAPKAAVALEYDYTVLYRELHEPQNIPTPHLFGAMVASRIVF